MLNKKVTVIAPAKINLTLHITGKRDDGFHTLKSVMQSISLYDIVNVNLNSSGRINITCTDENIPCDKRNIAYKAAQAFFDTVDLIDQGADIHIEKHIPSEAGLGGGSADGAAVLVALNALCGSNLSDDELCSIGVKVGADIPFCIKGGTKLCEGIGEIISDAPPFPTCYLVLGKGNQGISTKEAFGKIDSLSDLSGFDFNIDAFDNGDVAKSAEICSNIFERVSDVREIKEIKEKIINNGGLNAVMSGSGSAVYGIFTDIDLAEKCCLELAECGFFSSICRPISHGSVIK